MMVYVWIDGEQLINQWSNETTTYSATISLQADTPVLIRMDYYEAGGGGGPTRWRPNPRTRGRSRISTTF